MAWYVTNIAIARLLWLIERIRHHLFQYISLPQHHRGRFYVFFEFSNILLMIALFYIQITEKQNFST